MRLVNGFLWKTSPTLGREKSLPRIGSRRPTEVFTHNPNPDPLPAATGGIQVREVSWVLLLRPNLADPHQESEN